MNAEQHQRARQGVLWPLLAILAAASAGCPLAADARYGRACSADRSRHRG